MQIDYGSEDQAAVAGTALDKDGNEIPVISVDAQWWGIGGGLTYTFGDKWSVAARADYFNDINGARTSQSPSLAPFPITTGQELSSPNATLI